MSTAPVKSRLTLGSWVGFGGFAAMVLSLILGIMAPDIGRVFVWIAGLVALAGAGILLNTALSWSRRLRERERRGDETAPPDA
jgi:hypothetical protein